MRPHAIVGLGKRDLLSYLAHIDEVTASDIARAFGVRYAVAAMGLPPDLPAGAKQLTVLRQLRPLYGFFLMRMASRLKYCWSA